MNTMPSTTNETNDKMMNNSSPLELQRPVNGTRTISVIVPRNLYTIQDRIDADGHSLYKTNQQLTSEPSPKRRVTSSSSVAFTSVIVSSSGPCTPIKGATGVQSPPSTSKSTVIVNSTVCIREQEQQMREKEEHELVPAMSTPSSCYKPHANQVAAPQSDSLSIIVNRYPVMWQGILALKTDQAAVKMHFLNGNLHVARASLFCHTDGSSPPLLRVTQRMRLEEMQLVALAKKMQYNSEMCILLALPCGHDNVDVLQQSRNLQTGFISYLQEKMAAGIVEITIPGSEQAAYVVHIFPSCKFANQNLRSVAPDLKKRVAEIAHLIIVIVTAYADEE